STLSSLFYPQLESSATSYNSSPRLDQSNGVAVDKVYPDFQVHVYALCHSSRFLRAIRPCSSAGHIHAKSPNLRRHDYEQPHLQYYHVSSRDGCRREVLHSSLHWHRPFSVRSSAL
ncbi:hypothetical protein PMAYCL1PPCAC_08590, partial [Pristionchus mayeri]